MTSIMDQKTKSLAHQMNNNDYLPDMIQKHTAPLYKHQSLDK